MARQEIEQTVGLPILDRLIDDDPKLAADPPVTRAQSVRMLKTALRRDLEWLLNTRRNVEEAPESFQFLSRSLFNYGLPDITSLGFNNIKDRKRLQRHLEEVVQRYEPRIAHPKVTLVEDPRENLTRVLRFQIEGMLIMDPAPERITFDTVLQLSNGECEVKGG